MDNKAFFQLSYGVYLLSAAEGGKLNGCIVNTACQVTSAPPRVSVTVNKENYTCGMIQRTGAFAVNILTEDAQLPFIGRFGFASGRDVPNKFGGMEVTRSKLGNPVLLSSPEVGAVLDCRVVSTLDVGTHIIFVGEVEDAIVTGFGTPMTYAHYHAVKKGVTPPKASAYQPPEEKSAAGPRWRCTVCGYIHEGPTPPDKCPVCGQGAEKFESV